MKMNFHFPTTVLKICTHSSYCLGCMLGTMQKNRKTNIFCRFLVSLWESGYKWKSGSQSWREVTSVIPHKPPIKKMNPVAFPRFLSADCSELVDGGTAWCTMIDQHSKTSISSSVWSIYAGNFNFYLNLGWVELDMIFWNGEGLRDLP